MYHSQRKNNSCFLMPVFFVFLSTALGLWSCSGKDHAVGAELLIRIGSSFNEPDALLYIADEQNLFAANGLNIQLMEYTTGLAAANAMLKGEVDLSTASDFVIAGKAMEKQRILDMGTIAEFQNEYVIGRMDKGIHDISELAGKKIGLTRRTSTEFNFGRFLDLHGLNIGQVTTISLSPEKAMNALLSGDVDGVVIWEPYASMVKERLGKTVVEWSSQSGQSKYWNLIGTDTWLTDHPDLARRVLNSLSQAENYLVHHPDKAKAFVQKRLHRDDTYMARVWPQHHFNLSLEQKLITAMKDQAHWMIRNNYTREKAIPDFTNYIYADGLKAVNPKEVSIIY